MSQEPLHAVVLSGGGATGAYEVGVLKALLAGNDAIDPLIYSGASVGAVNAAFMVAQKDGTSPASRAEKLEKIWRDHVAERPAGRGNGVFRIRANLLATLDPRWLLRGPAVIRDAVRDGVYLTNETLKRLVDLPRPGRGTVWERLLEVPDLSAFIDTSPLRELLRQHLDRKHLQSSSRKLRVVACDWQRGKHQVWARPDIGTDGEDGVDRLMAAMAVPGVFPPVQVGSKTYVDGGLIANTPLWPAIRAWMGLDEPAGRRPLVVHLVSLDADLADVPVGKHPSTVGSIDRVIEIAQAANVEKDVNEVEWRNQEIVDYHGAGARGREPWIGLKPVTVHRYQPRRDLSGAMGVLDFSRERIDRLIRKGYDDTRGHNCERAGCVLASEYEERAAERRAKISG